MIGYLRQTKTITMDLNLELVTVEDAANQLYIHPHTLLRYIREGKLVAAKIGRRYLLRPADLEKFVTQSATVSQ